MISKKRAFKAFRLILCLAVIVSVSSLFFTVEPMASENSDSQPLMAEEHVIVTPQVMRARPLYTPVMAHHLALSPMDVSQTVCEADITTALANLEEEPQSVPDTVEIAAEPAESEIEITYEEESWADSWAYEEEEEEEDSYILPPAEKEESSASSEESSSSAAGSYSELDYLAAICQIEAGYHYEGCLAVANVVLNRIHAGFGGSVQEVIYQSYQFSTGWMDYYLENGTSSTARDAAAAALAGSNNIGGFLYFNGTTWLDPETLTCPYVVIGGNVFY